MITLNCSTLGDRANTVSTNRDSPTTVRSVSGASPACGRHCYSLVDQGMTLEEGDHDIRQPISGRSTKQPSGTSGPTSTLAHPRMSHPRSSISFRASSSATSPSTSARVSSAWSYGPPDRQLGRHKHRSPVTGFTVEGHWAYRESTGCPGREITCTRARNGSHSLYGQP